MRTHWLKPSLRLSGNMALKLRLGVELTLSTDWSAEGFAAMLGMRGVGSWWSESDLAVELHAFDAWTALAWPAAPLYRRFLSPPASANAVQAVAVLLSARAPEDPSLFRLRPRVPDASSANCTAPRTSQG